MIISAKQYTSDIFYFYNYIHNSLNGNTNLIIRYG